MKNPRPEERGIRRRDGEPLSRCSEQDVELADASACLTPQAAGNATWSDSMGCGLQGDARSGLFLGSVRVVSLHGTS